MIALAGFENGLWWRFFFFPPDFLGWRGLHSLDFWKEVTKHSMITNSFFGGGVPGFRIRSSIWRFRPALRLLPSIRPFGLSSSVIQWGGL